MPGTITFKPIEANLNHDADLIGKADPYCMFLVNGEKIKSQVSTSGGKHPIWNDIVTVPASNQPTCFVEIKDKDILKDDKLGSFEIDLREIEMQGRIKKWYPIFHKDKPAGEILMEAEFRPQGGLSHGMGGIGAAPIQTHGMPVQSHGIIGAAPIQTHGMPIQSHGMPIQSHGMPIQSHGMPIQSQGIPVTHSTMIPVQSHTIHSHGLGGNVTQQTEIRTHETFIGGAPLQQQQQYAGNQGYGESLSEQYAREALIRGVDPLGTHLHQYPGQMAGPSGFIDSTHPIPQTNLAQSSGILNPQANMSFPANQGLPGQPLSHHHAGQNIGGQPLPGQNIPPNKF